MYFKDLGEENAAGEIPVCCPFPHRREDGTEYMEKVPSAHVNLSRGVFHCKVCRGLGRFNDGGLSEIDFYAKINGVSYMDALQMFDLFTKSKTHNWEQNVKNLLESDVWMQMIRNMGLTEETVKTLQLGQVGDGIQFPVFIYGELLDIRTYHPEATPKVKGEKGSKPLIFPFDLWINDDRPTLLCEGEKDTAIARQMGFNAITITGGAGSFPKILRNSFKGKDVYIAYDCDDAGRSGARVVAYHLHGVAKNIFIVDLGLEDKEDIHDFFIKYKRSADDLFQLMQNARPFTPEDYQQEKERLYPLVDLWDAPKGQYSGRVLSSRVILSGRFDQPMEVPSVVEWNCTGRNPESETCLTCPFFARHGEGPYFWTLTEENSDDLLKLVDGSLKEAQINKTLRNFAGIPDECPGYSKAVRARKSVTKAVLIPDAQRILKDDPMAKFKTAELIAYILEQDNGIDIVDGERYRMNYKRYPHPNQGAKLVAVVHHVEQSDSPVESFRMTPEIKEQLKVFQGEAKTKMPLLAEMARKIVGPHIRPELVYCTDIMYHSPLQFYFGGKLMKKGYPEIAIVGDTRTGKTDVATALGAFYGVGTYTDVKNASVAGLIGGAEQITKGTYKITWGTIVLNHRGLVVLDEFSGISKDMMGRLTSVRSSQEAHIEKIAKGTAPAYTRLLWISNPRPQESGASYPLSKYPSGVVVLEELFGTYEDIARFDLVYLAADTGEYISPLAKVDVEPYDQEAYRNLVYWAWSRRADQVVFDEGIEELIVDRATLLNQKYKLSLKLFGPEAWKKIARLSVAVAARLFSCDETGEKIVVKKDHVDFACRFMVDCYDNKVFRIKQVVEKERQQNETDENVNKIVATLIRQFPQVLRHLYETPDTSNRNLQAVAGLEKNQYEQLMSKLYLYHLIEMQRDRVVPTQRFRKAVDAALEANRTTYLQPLSTGGL